MAGLNEDQYTEVKEGIAEIRALATAFAKLETAIMGNGTKGLKQRMDEAETDIEKLRDCQGKEKPPKFSWKQVIANTVIIITFAGFLTGFMFYMMDAVSKKVDRLDDKLDSHIMISHIP